MWPYPPKWVTLIIFMKFWFFTLLWRAFIFFSIDTKILQICLQVQKLLINQSGYRRVPFWKVGLRKFVSHTIVLQQLQFKMPETVIRHHIWPLKVMFLNRIMPEAPEFDENRKSVFLTCRLKFIAFCVVTKYQCNSFWAEGPIYTESM